jgi:Family of unknown function (DUF6220)
MVRSIALRTHRIAAWALVAGIAAQMAMTTFGLFIVAGGRGYLLHATFGRTLAMLPLLLVVTALVARVDRRDLAVVAAIVGLVAIQVGLVMLAHGGVSAAMALHPVNGGALFVTAGYLASRADDYADRVARPTAARPMAADAALGAGA